MRNPINRSEWQDAVDLADFFITLDSARQYGLVEGGPKVNLERCEELLAAGSKRGIVPRPDAIDRCLAGLGKVDMLA